MKVRLHTSHGDIEITLDTERAPNTAENFAQYVREGHYDGTIFHRVVAEFMIQGGGYTADFKLKPTRPNIPNESGNGLSNVRGTIAMARTGDPHSADSQFFINVVNNDTDRLDPMPTKWGYAVFGKVVDGMDVVDEIAYGATGPGGPFAENVPAVPVIIEKVSLVGGTEDE